MGFQDPEVRRERSATHLMHVSLDPLLDPLAHLPVARPGKPKGIKEFTKRLVVHRI